MSERTNRRTGGQLLVDALKVHGVDLAFCVPGESYLAVLDALYDARNSIRLVTCRQEGGAANMAEAYGKLTGRPGICFVTRGPGATNASIGVHTAFQDSTPMILFVGQVARDQAEREAFQEVDYRRMFAPLAKWAAQIDDPARVPELVSQAFHRAVAGRPGPVVIALPEDMLTATAEVGDTGPYKAVRPHPGPAELQAMRDLLAKAERPFLLLGGGGWDAQAVRDIAAFAEANDLPVGVSFRCQDLIDNTHKNYAGHVGIGPHPALAAQVRDADVLLVVGARLGEMTTGGYTLLEVPMPKQTLIHVHAGAEELGRVYQPTLAINAGMAQFAAAARALAPVDPSRWAARTAQAHRDYLTTLEHEGHAGPVQMPAVMKVLRERLPPDAILTNGAGNYTTWLHRFYQYPRFRTQLAPTSGAMGYGLPAAVAAKAVHPARTVVCFAGDGCFLMNGQELATAVQYGLAIIVIVVNNGMYGTIRMHQEREYPTRVHGTDLANPDFAALARAFGAWAETVETTAEFAPALDRALEQNGIRLLHCKTDVEVISNATTIAKLRSSAK